MMWPVCVSCWLSNQSSYNILVPIVEHAHFHVDGKVALHLSMLDEHRGQTVQVSYPKVTAEPDWVTSFEVPAHPNNPAHPDYKPHHH